ERWLPVDGSKREQQGRDAQSNPVAAIDRAVLANWLSDKTTIDSLLGKFRDTAIESERIVEACSRSGDLAALAAAAHKLKGAAQAVGATGIATAADCSSAPAKLATPVPAARALDLWRASCAARWPRLMARVELTRH